VTPFEAGVLAGVALDNEAPFIGRDALRRLRDAPLDRKVVTFVVDDPAHWVWGGEAVSLDGAAVGELSSAGWSAAAGRCVALGALRGAAARQVHAGTRVSIDLWGEPVGATAWDRWAPTAQPPTTRQPVAPASIR